MNKLNFTGINNRRSFLLIASVSILLSLIIGIVVFVIMDTYYNVQPLWVEHFAYTQWKNVELLDVIKKHGIGEALNLEFLIGQRHILQTVILAQLYPELLGWPHSHLIIHIFLLSVFLLLYSWTIYKKTGNVAYTALGSMLFISAQGFVSERDGIGTGFIDFQSFLLLGSSILCLIHAFEAKSFWWIRMFALFVTLSVYARTTSFFFVAVIAFPLFCYYFFYLIRNGRSQRYMTWMIINVAILLAPIIFVFIRQITPLLWYYGTSNAHGLRKPIMESLSTMSKLFISFIGIPILLLHLVLLGITKLHKFRFNYLTATEYILLYWLLGYFLFLLFNGYTSDVTKEVMYAVPAFFLLCLLPLRRGLKLLRTQASRIPIFFLLAIVLFISQSVSAYKRASIVRPNDAKQRNTQIEMAGALTGLPENTVWQSYVYSDWGIPVSLLTHYHFGKFRKSYNQLFHNQKNYWDAYYPGKTLPEIEEALFEQSNLEIDAAVIMKDLIKPVDNWDETSYQIATYISRKIQTDSRWQFYATISAEPFQKEWMIYVNKQKGAV